MNPSSDFHLFANNDPLIYCPFADRKNYLSEKRT
jgi:hypothetical protein